MIANVRVENNSTAGTARRVLAHSRSRADNSSSAGDHDLGGWVARPAGCAVKLRPVKAALLEPAGRRVGARQAQAVMIASTGGLVPALAL